MNENLNGYVRYEMTFDAKQYILHTDTDGKVLRICVSYFGFVRQTSYRDIKRGSRIWKTVEEAFTRARTAVAPHE